MSTEVLEVERMTDAEMAALFGGAPLVEIDPGTEELLALGRKYHEDALFYQLNAWGGIDPAEYDGCPSCQEIAARGWFTAPRPGTTFYSIPTTPAPVELETVRIGSVDYGVWPVCSPSRDGLLTAGRALGAAPAAAVAAAGAVAAIRLTISLNASQAQEFAALAQEIGDLDPGPPSGCLTPPPGRPDRE